MPIQKTTVPPSAVEGLEDALAPIANPHVSVERQYAPGLLTVTVAPPELSKWNGVEAFCAHRGLDPSKVLAIGDGRLDPEQEAKLGSMSDGGWIPRRSGASTRGTTAGCCATPTETAARGATWTWG